MKLIQLLLFFCCLHDITGMFVNDQLRKVFAGSSLIGSSSSCTLARTNLLASLLVLMSAPLH